MTDDETPGVIGHDTPTDSKYIKFVIYYYQDKKW